MGPLEGFRIYAKNDSDFAGGMLWWSPFAKKGGICFSENWGEKFLEIEDSTNEILGDVLSEI